METQGGEGPNGLSEGQSWRRADMSPGNWIYGLLCDLLPKVIIHLFTS